ncbi:hypothetical protein BU16DRAFT_527630 [Lophium mytilinum]|uniref:Uncharacterized protein n=1 Tax=Lophium mytilinum TaxID=390894 RepID=A0A6A6QRC7_9PEZI|nr:hypothetical protein BU16DRAFT_527630 [Lophium mytilinum]
MQETQWEAATKQRSRPAKSPQAATTSEAPPTNPTPQRLTNPREHAAGTTVTGPVPALPIPQCLSRSRRRRPEPPPAADMRQC